MAYSEKYFLITVSNWADYGTIEKSCGHQDRGTT